MAHPSDEDLRLFGKILFYVLIIPALFYYIYQGVKFCFNVIFPINSNHLLEATDPDVKVDKMEIEKFEQTNKINNNENEENLTSQGNNFAYIVIVVRIGSYYLNQKKSFLSNFFTPSYQTIPSFSERLEDTIIDSKRSIGSRLKDNVYSSLDDAKEGIKKIDCEEDTVILEITSTPIAYRVIHPKEEVRVCKNSIMIVLVEESFKIIGVQSGNNRTVKNAL